MLLDGIKIKESILTTVKKDVAQLSFVPLFTDIVIGNDPASLQYAMMKKKTAHTLGFQYTDAFFSATINEEVLVKEIQRLVSLPHMSGIIIQVPVPSHLPQQTLLDTIPMSLDVDVLSRSAQESFYKDTNQLILPAAQAVMVLLEEAAVDFLSDKFVVVGQGLLVGKPVTHLLRKRGACVETITDTTSETKKRELLLQADVVVSAVGIAGLITGEMVKENVVVIDAGTLEVEGSIVGDVDVESVAPKARFYTPTPGGVGPVTVACLFANVVATAKKI
ncbi:MAG: bifunctional 5,10-methylenetetrahydrofolate dehydrogenase/5,10-methenyltetrahydrofolate cyclohydrolase [Candidatus Pacebacteria bacterium]|nr:bifunctional 5,10-methylenetetrahydrofolate dehydrogenase/5,10-methenyltetrahydrofolate cyclohydrolase [Candidatus Paceibacterota bacterium]